MAQIKVVAYQDEYTLIGERIRVFMKARENNGVSLEINVMETQPGYIRGYDMERLDITIAVEDVDYIQICPTGGTDIERFYGKQRGEG